MIARVTDRQLWYGIAAGLLVIMGWFAATRTTLLLAYGNGGTLTLHQVQGICASASAQIGRALSVPTAVNCGGVDSYAKWLNITGVAGLFLTVTLRRIPALSHRAPASRLGRRHHRVPPSERVTPPGRPRIP